MLIHLLPVNDLFDKLLDPVNYTNDRFQTDMLNPSNFVKEVGIGEKPPKYIFFHRYNASTITTESTDSEIFCSIVGTGFFEEPTTLNGSVFERNAKKLSMLNDNEEVVSFDDLVNLPVHSSISPQDYLNSKVDKFTFDGATTIPDNFGGLSGYAFVTEQREHWNEIFEYRIKENENENTVLLADNFFNAMVAITSDLADFNIDDTTSTESICSVIKTYFNSTYKTSRHATLKSFLDNLVSSTNESSENIFVRGWHYLQRTWWSKDNTGRDILEETLKDCFSIIKAKCRIQSDKALFADEDVATVSQKAIATSFVDSIIELHLPPGYAEIAIEMACCKLCSIAKNSVANFDGFTTTKDPIQELLTSYLNLLNTDFESFNMIYQHYVDTFIEISKNDVIGKSGRYNEAKGMIHFEIFSPKDCNIYEKLEINTRALIVDKSTINFFDVSHTIEKLKDVIEPIIGNSILKTSDGKYIMWDNEFEKLEESSIPSEYAVQHISEWSPTLTYSKFNTYHPNTLRLSAHVREDEEIKPFHLQDIVDETANETVEFKNKRLWTKEYFEQCAVPYHWSLKTSSGKNFFTDDFSIYYHPIYFLGQLMEKFNPSEPSTS